MRKRLKTMELVRGLTGNCAACLDCGENAKAASLCICCVFSERTSRPQSAVKNTLMHLKLLLENAKGGEVIPASSDAATREILDVHAAALTETIP